MSRNRSASFPVKPTRKPFNVTARATVSTDYNDIFRASDRIRYDTDDDEYRTARLAYGVFKVRSTADNKMRPSVTESCGTCKVLSDGFSTSVTAFRLESPPKDLTLTWLNHST